MFGRKAPMKISLFKNAKDSKPKEITTIDAFLEGVRCGTWRKQTERIRNELDLDIKKSLKSSIVPAVTVSGVFSQRNKDGLLEHSGFMSIDFDNVEDAKGVDKDPYTYACVKSVSGNGYFLIVKVDPEMHLESFRWLSEYYYKTYGLMLDEAPKSKASLRFASYDPDLVINKKSKQSKVKKREKKKPKGLPLALTGDEIGGLITEAVQGGINICEDYSDWLNVGFALASNMGETGRAYFHHLSGVSPKYKVSATDRQYNACLKGQRDGITIASLYWMLQQAGIEMPKQETSKIAFSLGRKAKGATKEQIAEELVELHGETKEKAEAIVEASDGATHLNFSDLGEDLTAVIDMFLVWVKQAHPTYKNEITGHYICRGKNVMGGYLNKIITDAKRTFNNSLLSTNLIKELLLSENMETRNPLIEGLKKEVPYTDELERLCATIETNTPLGSVFIRKWMLSLIYALHGEPVRTVLTFTGGQETGKTHWFRYLLPAWAKPYYAESKLDSGKDDEILMTEKWIILDDEGGGKSAKDARHFKMLTSKNYFNLRKPYDSANGDYKRLSVLAITSNDGQVINDPTGNTRILPIEIMDINRDLYNGIDKDALFCQLYNLYKSGESWQLTSDEKKSLATEFENFESDNPERDLLLTYFRVPTEHEVYEPRTSAEIKAFIEHESGFKFKSDPKFWSELSSLFREQKKSTRRQGKSLKCYHLAEVREKVGSRL